MEGIRTTTFKDLPGNGTITATLDVVRFLQTRKSLFGLLREDKTCLTLLKMLSDIAFEQIEGNFWYAAYGPFRVIMMNDTGYINATKLCISGGMKYKNWSRLQSSQQLINEVERHQALENTHVLFEGENLPLLDAKAHIWALASPPCIFVKTANNTPSEQLISGTYCHPDLVPSIAGWISPIFQIISNRVVNGYITNEYKHKLNVMQLQLEQSEEL